MSSRILSLAAALLAVTQFALDASAQTRNCVLVGQFDRYSTYNDVWGYVAPDGREYALLGATTGLVVVDCTNPATPIERGYFPWATSTWRDIRTYGHYAYVSSESGAGFQIIDLSNPDAPVEVGVFGSSVFSNAHNVCIDTATGLLYMVGTGAGTPVFDLNANPANPPYVGALTGPGSSNYFHDLCVQNGYAYGSMIYNGYLRIIDVSNGIPGSTVSNTSTPANFTHNAWPNETGTLVATTDERAGGVVKFFDISNKSNPIARGQFTPNSNSIPHNAFLQGDLCHVAWYTEGYQLIDVSDPANPVQVASYDTWLGASGGFNGCWGCYPFQPSGNIYLSDISRGLFIVRPQITDLVVNHTPLADTLDEDGPYPVVVTAAGSTPVQSTTLSYRVDGGAFIDVTMQPTANPDEYAAEIPGQDAVARVDYHLTIVDGVASRREPLDGEHDFNVGSFVEIFNDDFETDRGWTTGLVTNQNDWQRGAPAGRSGTSGGVAWADPSAAFSGTSIWANDLGNTGFNGSYQNGTGNWLQSPVISTAGLTGIRLEFRRWLSLAPGDTARILINGRELWSTSAGVQDSSWQLMTYELAPMLYGPTITIRFDLQTDGGTVAGGWALDDVKVQAASDAVPPSFYGNPTAGTGGVSPSIDLSASAMIGSTAQIDGADLLAGASSFLLLNFAPADQPLLGFDLLVDQAGLLALGQAASATGTASWSLPIPADPAVDNVYLYSQVLVVDPGSVGGTFAASEGMRFRVHVN